MSCIVRTGALVALAALLPASPALAADDRDGRIAAAVEAAFRPLMEKHGIPGMAVAVTVDGRRRFFTYGVTAPTGGVPVTKDTLFEIGSISKTFTATLAAYGVALGKLSLADAPSRYWPELRGSPVDAASLLHLATYTAGGFPLQFPDSVRSEGMSAYFRAWKPIAAPGRLRRYSNPSIGLFGNLAARAMGAPFADVMERELLPVLALRDTYVRVPAAAMERYAWGIGKAGRPLRVGPGVFAEEAYGVKTTAADLLRFIEINIGPDGLETAARRAVEATHVGYFRVGDMVQGLGWEGYRYPVSLEDLLAGNSAKMSREARPVAALSPPQPPAGPVLFNKTGSTNGFAAYAVFVPERRIGLVMLANRNFPIEERIRAAHAVLSALER